jgi:hypothetical protein
MLDEVKNRKALEVGAELDLPLEKTSDKGTSKKELKRALVSAKLQEKESRMSLRNSILGNERRNSANNGSYSAMNAH